MKVPDGIRTNVIPKVLVYVFSSAEMGMEKKMRHRTVINPKNILSVFLADIAILLIDPTLCLLRVYGFSMYLPNIIDQRL